MIKLTRELEKQLRDQIDLERFPQEGTLSYKLSALFNELDATRRERDALKAKLRVAQQDKM